MHHRPPNFRQMIRHLDKTYSTERRAQKSDQMASRNVYAPADTARTDPPKETRRSTSVQCTVIGLDTLDRHSAQRLHRRLLHEFSRDLLKFQSLGVKLRVSTNCRNKLLNRFRQKVLGRLG